MADPRERLSLAIAAGAVILPEAGRIAVLGPRAGDDLSALPRERVQVVTGIRPDHDALSAQGYDVRVAPEGRFAAAVVMLPRAKRLAQARIAEGAAISDGPVIVDGTKSDGVDAILKACRAHAGAGPVFSKAHGKVFTLVPPFDFGDWAAPAETVIEGGFVTAPGVFSADGIDPASAMLAGALPAKPGHHVVDLGAGWGYLSARLLEREGITRLDMVEADHAALDCARRNVSDPRAHAHWADAAAWQPEALADAVVTNPPFHTGRAADPDLGRAFIAAAARMLKPSGTLWLVANRHLSYEGALRDHFATVEEVAGDTRFKVLNARRPKSAAARTRR